MQEIFQDLKAGKADLTLGLAAGFHDQYARYGRHAITLFTQSVATPKKKEVEINNFRDLGKDGLKVIVSDSSLCHHLMLDYGWGDNAIPSRDLKQSIQQVSIEEQGQIVCNTPTLKWLINRYHLDNLELTPVNMPHGEYKFMSKDQHLLDLLDKAYADLYTDEQIRPIENKWFYPEQAEQEIPAWVWYLVIGALILLVTAIAYTLIYRLQNKRVTKANNQLNRRLALIIETSKVRIWTYNVSEQTFAWRNDNGKVAYIYPLEEFAKRYSESDFARLRKAIDRIVSQQKDAKGHAVEELTVELKAKDMEGGDNELHDFIVTLSVLRHDNNGKPSVLIGTKKDVTEARRLKQLEDERTLRYWSIFYSEDAAIFLFDKKGIIQEASPKACELCHYNGDELIKQHEIVAMMRHFVRFYEFLLQVSCFEDTDLHKKYNFITYLLAYINIKHPGGGYNLDGKIKATNFVQKKAEEHTTPNLVAKPVVKLPTAESFGLTEAKEERLSQIIAEINSRTGKAYDNDVAVKAMLQIRDILMKSDKLKTSAKNNTVKDFEFSYFDDIDDALIEGLEQNQDFFSLLLSNDEIKKQVLGIFTEEIYKSLREA